MVSLLILITILAMAMVIGEAGYTNHPSAGVSKDTDCIRHQDHPAGGGLNHTLLWAV